LSAPQAHRLHAAGFSANGLVVVLLLLVSLGGLAWVYSGMVTLDRWPIRWLEVDGSFERVSAEQVRSSVAALVEGSYFTVDLEEVRRTAENITWVSDARVRKEWPDTVRVEVREFVPVAHWTDGRLVGSNRVPFEVPGADEIQGLPWLEGPEGSLEEVLEAWLAFDQLLLPTGQPVDRLRLDRRGSWSLVLANGTRVELGREAARERLARMVASWNELLRVRGRVPLRVDLRYSNGFAVRWPEEAVDPGRELAGIDRR
jgi:cell division protein FtsQ